MFFLHLVISDDDSVYDQREYEQFVKDYWAQLSAGDQEKSGFSDLQLHDRTIGGVPAKQISYIDKGNYFNTGLFLYLDDRMIIVSFRCKYEEKTTFDAFAESIEVNK